MKPTRLSVTLATLQFLRQEPSASHIRFEILLILAGNTDESGKYLPMSSYQIMHHMGNSGPNNATLASMADAGLIEASPGQKKGKVFKIAITGLHEVHRILGGQKRQPPAPQPDMAKVAAAIA